jgi:hypothetical protein
MYEKRAEHSAVLAVSCAQIGERLMSIPHWDRRAAALTEALAYWIARDVGG